MKVFSLQFLRILSLVSFIRSNNDIVQCVDSNQSSWHFVGERQLTIDQLLLSFDVFSDSVVVIVRVSLYSAVLEQTKVELETTTQIVMTRSYL